MMESLIINSSKREVAFSDLVFIAYLIITGLLLVRFSISLLTIIKLERSSKYDKIGDFYVRRVHGISGSFTFFNWIFIETSFAPDQKEYQAILHHEKAHALLKHSYDLILIELYIVFFWWLPSSWLTRRELKKIHEYQADAYALTSCDSEWYSSILISSTLKSNGLSLASSFHDGLIIKRLKAMKQNVKMVSTWKIGVLTTIGILLFVMFACNDKMDQEIKKIGEQSNAITFDQLPVDMKKAVQKH